MGRAFFISPLQWGFSCSTADKSVNFFSLQVEVRPMMFVALTYDHRLIDGREAVTFLRKIKAAVEDPRVLLLDL